MFGSKKKPPVPEPAPPFPMSKKMRELEFVEELLKATVDGRLGWDDGVGSYLAIVGHTFLRLNVTSYVRLDIDNQVGNTIRSYGIGNEDIPHLHGPLKALAVAVQNDGDERMGAMIAELRSRKVPT